MENRLIELLKPDWNKLRNRISSLAESWSPSPALSDFVDSFLDKLYRPGAEIYISSPVLAYAISREDPTTFISLCVNDAQALRETPSTLVLSKGWACSADIGRIWFAPQFERLVDALWMHNSSSSTLLKEVKVEWLSKKFRQSIIRDGPVADGFFSTKRRFEPLSSEQISQFRVKVSSAIEIIEQTCPETSYLAQSILRVIVPGRTRSEYSSRVIRHGCSARQFWGAVFFNDYHLEQISVYEVAENIVHELIHNLLFLREEVAPWYEEKSQHCWIERIIPSLWSERELQAYSFFHSLFVFAVLFDWVTVLRQSGLPGSNEYGERRSEEIAKGFSKIPDSDIFFAIPNIKEFLSPEGIEMIDILRTRLERQGIYS